VDKGLLSIFYLLAGSINQNYMLPYLMLNHWDVLVCSDILSLTCPTNQKHKVMKNSVVQPSYVVNILHQWDNRG
jgi:hypothetical protein